MSITTTAVLDRIADRLVWLLAALIVGLVGLYIYFVNVSVFNIMERRVAEERLSTLGTEVALLEAEYIALSSHIDLALAYERGFRELADNEAAYTARVASPVTVSFARAAARN